MSAALGTASANAEIDKVDERENTIVAVPKTVMLVMSLAPAPRTIGHDASQFPIMMPPNAGAAHKIPSPVASMRRIARA
jgi:hypothetical protein